MIQKRNNIFYISVESRKGGVGKTTAALVLSQCLLEKGFQVLYLDLDITGTRIQTSFADNTVLSLREVTENGEPVNMLRLFRDNYLEGQNLLFTHEFTEKNKLCIQNNCVNILESDIYKSHEKDTTVRTIIIEPTVLYDAFHAYWMMEMIQVLAQSFADSFDEKDKIAIVLDNAPGYSSLESVIHDYITDIGPDLGKFLFVSSLDIQDLDACRNTISELTSIHSDKKMASAYYHQLLEKPWESYKNQVLSSKKSRAFQKAFDTLLNEEPKDWPPVFTKDCLPSDASAYMGLVVNKVIGDMTLPTTSGLTPLPVPFYRHMHTLFWDRKSESQVSESSTSNKSLLRDQPFKTALREIQKKDEAYNGEIKSYPISEHFDTAWTLSSSLAAIRTACFHCGLAQTEIEPAAFDKMDEADIVLNLEFDDAREIRFAFWYSCNVSDNPGTTKFVLNEYLRKAKNYITASSNSLLLADISKSYRPGNDENAELFDAFITLVNRLYYCNDAYTHLSAILNKFKLQYGLTELVDKDAFQRCVNQAFDSSPAFNAETVQDIYDLLGRKIDFAVLQSCIDKILAEWGLER